MEKLTLAEHFGVEIIGTMLLILLGNGVVANTILKKTKGYNGGWISITAGWGMAVAIAAFVAASLSGVAHLNPVITIAGIITNQPWFQNYGYGLALLLLLAQAIGTALGQICVIAVYWMHIKKTLSADNKMSEAEKAAAILAIHCTIPQNRKWVFNFLTEFLATSILVLGFLIITNKSNISQFGYLFMGAIVFVIGVSLGGPTGFAINPTRDFIPRIIHKGMWWLKGKGSSELLKYAWIPIVSPLLATIVVSFLFKLL